MFPIVLLTLFSILSVESQLVKDDSCLARKTLPGTCKYFEECNYARLLVADHITPDICSYDDDSGVELVCCPIETPPDTGVYRDIFDIASKGVVKSTHMTCRYNNDIPIVCCQNQKQEDPEPDGCPRLPKPYPERANDIPYTKCIEYQRYVHWCESDSESLKDAKYKRNYICEIDDGDSARIFGGVTAASPKENPHMAVLGCRRKNLKDSEIAWVGGATLISESFLLTAAHVLFHNDHGAVRYALLGVIDKTKIDEGLLTNIIRRIGHKEYDSTKKKHDIALLELDRRISFTEYIRPACLPGTTMTLKALWTVAGWGSTSRGAFQVPAQILQKTNVMEVEKESCTTKLVSQDFVFDPKTMICARGLENRLNQVTDSCEGDSGGPITAVSDTFNCSHVVIGVVSWGPTCGNNNPAVYTRVQYYLDWITNEVWPVQK